MVERDRLETLADQLLVEDVEHLEERRLVADRVDRVALELSGRVGPRLTPDRERDVGQVSAMYDRWRVDRGIDNGHL
jgi:hypothetical protein